MSHWLDNDTVGWSFSDVLKVIPGYGSSTAPVSQQQVHVATNQSQINQLLYNAGFPAAVAPWSAAQAILESINGTSHVAKTDNNLSGIKWVNKPYQKATRGIKSPEGNYYAHYATWQDWANDFKRVLSVGPDAPINATSMQDYVNRLHKHKYFTSSPTLYYNLMAGIVGMPKQVAPSQAAAAQTAFDADTSGIPTWVKWGFGGLAGIIVLKSVLK